MPKRIIDGEGLWKSNKIRNLPDEVQPEYPYLLPLALANGVFEYDPVRIWSIAYSFSRPNIDQKTVEHFLYCLRKGGLLFVWEEDGKQWGYWVGSNKPGRLPGPSRQGINEAIGPNPPMNLVEEYEKLYKKLSTEESMDSIGIQKFLGLGFGLGSGIGLGSGSGAQEIPLQKEENMSLKNEIMADCIRVLGVDPPKANSTVWVDLKPYRDVYGDDAVAEAFRLWAADNQGENINYPVSAFAKSARKYLQEEFKKKPNLTLDKLIVDLISSAGHDVIFDKSQIREIGRMLEKYSDKEILFAFREFYGKLDEFQSKNAVKKFVEGGGYLIEAQRQEKAKAEQTRKDMDREIEEIRVKEAGEKARKAAQEAESEVFDPLFEIRGLEGQKPS